LGDGQGNFLNFHFGTFWDFEKPLNFELNCPEKSPKSIESIEYLVIFCCIKLFLKNGGFLASFIQFLHIKEKLQSLFTAAMVNPN
jgi:hypothetical protein